MTRQETSERYHIPMHILQEYESWDLRGTAKRETGDRQYDDADLEYLGTILTLRDIGFTSEEAKAYMYLLPEGDHTAAQRLKMLEERRRTVLEEIHLRERQLQRLDCLRHRTRKAQGDRKG